MGDSNILTIEDLKFRWPSGQRDVLDIAHLKVKKGETLFVKGPSGSGKTTLLSIIAGINQAQEGLIHVLGQDLGSLKQSQRDGFRANHIGFIFQLFNLIPYLSVLENITLACKFSPMRTKRAEERSSSVKREAQRLLAHLKMTEPEVIAKPVSDLSVGQQQRVAAARAMIGSPELIIADEPTSALDSDTREHFIELLLGECDRNGTTVLFVSHDSGLEGLFQRSLNLDDINNATSVSGDQVVGRVDAKNGENA